MIAKDVKLICAEYWKIKNYSKAIADKNETWILHHRDEVRKTPSGIIVVRSQQELIDNGRYFNCPANELIFIKKKYHSMLHSTFRTEETLDKISSSCSKALKGRKLSEEHKSNLSKAKTGSHNKVKRNPLTKQQKKNISDGTKKAMNDSELREHLSKMAKARVALHPIPNANWKKGKHKVKNSDGTISWV